MNALLSHITISLPDLWIWGHLTAIAGAVLVVVHRIKPIGQAVLVSVAGGFASCAFLAHILSEIHKTFFGTYALLAWVIAFLAGYAASTPIAYIVRI